MTLLHGLTALSDIQKHSSHPAPVQHSQDRLRVIRYGTVQTACKRCLNAEVNATYGERREFEGLHFFGLRRFPPPLCFDAMRDRKITGRLQPIICSSAWPEPFVIDF